MFGYITINKDVLTEAEIQVYQACYCGLCDALYRSGGPAGQLTLTYDMTFLVLLLESLYEHGMSQAMARCLPHPVRKRMHLKNDLTDYAADMNILLAYDNLLDDWRDDRRVDRAALAGLLKKRHKRICAARPRQAKAVKDYMTALSRAEAEGDTGLETAAVLTGRMLAEIFVIQEDHWAMDLRQMGFYLGKFIYLIDAYEDIEEDLKKDSYNPLKGLYGREDFDDQCKEILMMQMGECCRAFERLPIVENAGLLRNILYSGVWAKFAAVYQRRTKTGDGE